MKPSVVILAYNSVETLGATLAQAQQISDDLHVVDSFSTDDTVALSQQHGAQVVQHAFESYGAQRNWAIDHLTLRYPWQLHLDADERLTPELIASVQSLPENPDAIRLFDRPPGAVSGAAVAAWRHVAHLAFAALPQWRRALRGAQIRPALLPDQGSAGQLQGYMIDEIRMSLSEWTARHNRWSDAEVMEQTQRDGCGPHPASLLGKPLERKRFLRGLYNGAPLFVRPYALFFYRYFLRLGFLDGREGFIFWTLQTFWFRFLIDAKLFEHGKTKGFRMDDRRNYA